VDAIIEDACNWRVLTTFENVALFAAILEMLKEPAGFVITVELSSIELTCVPCMLVNTVKLLVVTALEAVIFCVLIPGSVIGSEKRRSFAR
jgi:hypothetical protein